jgi:ATP-dependent Lhr-like helicase
VDHAQLRELLGRAELRQLLDPEAIAEVEAELGRRTGRRPVRTLDALHDLLLEQGPLELDALTRCTLAAPHTDDEHAATPSLVVDEASRALARALADGLVRARRALWVRIGGRDELAAVEDAARLRDALGTMLPAGLPDALLRPVAAPLDDLVRRHARTHGPFRADELAARLGLGVAALTPVLERLTRSGALVAGAFLPDGASGSVEHCDAGVLRRLRLATLARLRKAIEPVSHATYAWFLATWHGIAPLGEPPSSASSASGASSPTLGSLTHAARGDGRAPTGGVAARPSRAALLSAVERLSGAPLLVSALETELLPARVPGYREGDLDALVTSGEVSWRGLEPLGESDGRIALTLGRPDVPPPEAPPEAALDASIVSLLRAEGALFFDDLAAATEAFAPELVAALGRLALGGYVTNDTLAPLRALGRAGAARGERPGRGRALRAGPVVPPGGVGRWSLGRGPLGKGASETERALGRVVTLLERHGVLTREAMTLEAVTGGFSAVYGLLRELEDAGRVRRGYFVADLTGAQFAVPGVEERLRELERESPREGPYFALAATDPAQPWGATLPWPTRTREDGPRPGRAAGATVLLRAGRPLGVLGRGERSLVTFASSSADERSLAHQDLAEALARLVSTGGRRALVLATIDGLAARDSELAPALEARGFVDTSRGLFLRRGATPPR